MSLNLGLIDYGMGNLHSVEKCLERLGQGCSLIHNAIDLDGVDALILPGVGAFDPAMANLRATGLVPHLLRWAKTIAPCSASASACSSCSSRAMKAAIQASASWADK